MSEQQSPFLKWTRIFAILSAWTSLLLGLFFFFCWEMGIYSVLMNPTTHWFFPISTVFCLLFSGLAFLNLLYRSKIPFYRICGGIILLFAGLRLVEIIFSLDLGLNSFFLMLLIKKPPEFWPMRLMGAINYTLIGAIFLFWPKQNRSKTASIALAFSCLLVLFISFQGVAAPILPTQSEYLEQILSIHFLAALTLIILSAGLLSWRFHLDLLEKINIQKWLPWMATIAFFAFNTFFFLAISQQNQLSLKDATFAKGTAIKSNVEAKLLEISNLLLRQTDRLENQKNFTTPTFLIDVKNILHQFPSIQQIGWLDAKGTLINSISLDPSEKNPIDFPQEVFQKEQQKTEFSAYIDGNTKNIILYNPVHFDSEFSGFIFFEVDPYILINQIENQVDFQGYEVQITSDHIFIYQYERKSTQENQYTFKTGLTFGKVALELTVSPSPDLFLMKMSRFSTLSIAIGGSFGSLLVGFMIYLIQSIRLRTIRLQKVKNELELSQGILQILNEAENMSEASEKVALKLHQAYGWELYFYWIWDEKKKKLVISQYFSVPGTSFPNFIAASLEMTPNPETMLAKVFQQQKPYWSSDFGKESFVRSPAALKDQIRGMVAFPVYKKNQMLGVAELYKREVLLEPPEKKWLEFIQAIETQFGFFIEKKELDLLRSEFSAIVASSFDAIYTVDSDLKIKRWNAGAERLYGWKEEEIVGQDASILYPEDHNRDYEYLQKVKKEKASGKHFEAQRLRKDKTIVWANLIYSPILDRSGNLSAISIIAEDISERKELDRLKDEFISMVSHELRTPLTSIVGALGLLNKAEEFQGEMKELLRLALKNSDKLNQVINDILDIEKLQSGKFQMNLKPFELGPVVEEAIRLSTPSALENQIELIPQNILFNLKIQGDTDRLMQVLLNLLSNAIKFSLPKGKVLIQMEKRENKIVVSITDEGRGIPLDKQKLIFSKFLQLEGGNTKIRGAGLGLSISKSLVEQMGGTIGFVSEPNKGSTFYFEFPILEYKGVKDEK